VRFCRRDTGLVDRYARFRCFAEPRPALRQVAAF
jgi:hypothetical protein